MFRVLFVDDEPQILNGLRWMLSGSKERWQVLFAGSGSLALQMMEVSPVDVIVSDIRMPEMTGPQLLREVRRLYPATARVVLSGFADEAMIRDTIGVAHQFLSKPCDAGAIEQVVRALAAARVRFPVAELRRMAGDGTCIACAGTDRARLLEEVADPAATVRTIGAIVRGDLGMAARTLHLVNSAFFGISRCVGCPEHAVQLLGVERLRALATSATAFPGVRAGDDPGFREPAVALHAERVAALARAIVEAEGGSKAMVEQARLAAQLHDVGRLMLAAEFPARYRAVVDRSSAADREEVERGEFGASHAEVGAYLVSLWGLDGEIAGAIANHHRPATCAAGFSVLTALHAADALVGEASGDRHTALDREYLAAIGLGDRVAGWSALQAAGASVVAPPATVGAGDDPAREATRAAWPSDA